MRERRIREELMSKVEEVIRKTKSRVEVGGKREKIFGWQVG